jgi:AcrR family transcriptional regulator
MAMRTEQTKTVQRGRPREFDREAALGQAMRLFWQKGYEATSIADLTKAMGIGSPSLYAAFGSKEALYAEALQYYQDSFDEEGWGCFRAAATAREAVLAYLLNSARTLTACSAGSGPEETGAADKPNGCMVVLSTVGSEGHAELGELVRSARQGTVERIRARLEKAIADGELPPSADPGAIARFVQAVQSGMSIQARDGVSAEELESVARLAMGCWDAQFDSAGTPLNS